MTARTTAQATLCDMLNEAFPVSPPALCTQMPVAALCTNAALLPQDAGSCGVRYYAFPRPSHALAPVTCPLPGCKAPWESWDLASSASWWKSGSPSPPDS